MLLYTLVSSLLFHIRLNGPSPLELVRSNGYRADSHYVTTEDGYILHVLRLPGGPLSPLNCSLPPVILIHGLLASSVSFLIAGPLQALAYLLADLGYDVWVVDLRGNTYSKGHVCLPNDDVRFWNFSWHEMGVFDVPAVIDYVLNTTGHQQVLYVGHSMGTSVFFVMCSLRPEYNDKVQFMVALAPSAYYAHIRSAFNIIIPIRDEFNLAVQVTSHGEFLSRDSLLVEVLSILSALEFSKPFCASLLFAFFGFNPTGTNLDLLPEFFKYLPAGASSKTVLHYAQIFKTDYFRQFDHGSVVENMAAYGSPSPPDYNLSLVTTPMAFLYGDNDILVTPEDVLDLTGQFKNVKLFRANLSTFNHIDYLIAKAVKSLVNDPVISQLQINQRLDPSIRTPCTH